jgi:hypothetical protein
MQYAESASFARLQSRPCQLRFDPLRMLLLLLAAGAGPASSEQALFGCQPAFGKG